MKAFVTAGEAASAIEGAQPLKFQVDDRELTAYPPKDGQMMLFMAAMGENHTANESAAGVIDFLDGIFEDDDRLYFRGRLMDRKDAFGVKQIQDIFQWLVAEWSARPTMSPPVSTASPPSTGQNSTAKRRSVAATSPA